MRILSAFPVGTKLVLKIDEPLQRDALMNKCPT